LHRPPTPTLFPYTTLFRSTQEHAHPTNVLAWWQRGQNEPWLLATNLSTAREARRAYRCRMWIEEMFGDFKGHGFDLESTHLRQRSEEHTSELQSRGHLVCR